MRHKSKKPIIKTGATHKCGCPHATNATGTARLAEIAAAPTRECVTHYKQRRQTETEDLRKLYPTLPQLVGSPAQISWADQVRLNLVHNLTTTLGIEQTDVLPGSLASHLVELMETDGEKDHAKLLAYLTETSAEYFIHRKFLQRRHDA